MARKVSATMMVLLVTGACLLIAAGWNVQRRSDQVCGICARHINPQAGVIADVGGRRYHVCCAHCAVTQGLQEHKPVRLIEVTEYGTGRKLQPEQAWYVDGSRVVACTHESMRLDEMKQVQQSMFDRCSPGTLAFETRAAAEQFAQENGGAVRNMTEMLAGVGEVRP